MKNLKIRWGLAASFMLISVSALQAAEVAQTTFFKVYLMTQEAESLEQRGEMKGALDLYYQVELNLKNLQENYPQWESSVVRYRLNNVKEIITELEFRVGPESGAQAQHPKGQPTEADRQQEAAEPEVVTDGTLKAGVSQPMLITDNSKPESDHNMEIRKAEKIDNPDPFAGMPRKSLKEVAFDETIESLRSQFHDALTQLAESKSKEADLKGMLDVFKRENEMLANEFTRYRKESEAIKSRLQEKTQVFASENRMLADENRRMQDEAKRLAEQIEVFKNENKMVAGAYQQAQKRADNMQKVASGTVMNMERVRMQIGSLRSLMKLRRDSLKALLAHEGLKNDQSTRAFLLQLEDISAKSEELLGRLESQRAVMEVRAPKVGVAN
ncbi:MAG: hypothetical protein AAGA18_15225 [Verrucomicrobiota bacterium]